MNNINEWEVRNGFLLSSSPMITAYRRRTTNARAIRMYRDVVDKKKPAYKDLENKLKDKTYGIYFLYKHDDLGNTEIYVGKTFDGLNRIYNHAARDYKDNQSYKDWVNAIYIYSDEFGDITEGVASNLESVFIRQLMSFAEYTNDESGKLIVHNSKKEKDANKSPEDPTAYIMYWTYINDMLLNSDIGVFPTVELRKLYSEYISEAYTQMNIRSLIGVKEFENAQKKIAITDDEKRIKRENLREMYRSLLDESILKSGIKTGGRLYYNIGEVLSNNKSSLVVTPDGTNYIHNEYGNEELVEDNSKINIVNDMLALIPDENLYNDAKILCLYSKDGAFPAAILRKAIKEMKDAPGNKAERATNILKKLIKNKLYIVVPDLLCYYNTLKKVMMTYNSLMSKITGSRFGLSDDDYVIPMVIMINNFDVRIKTEDGKRDIMRYIESEFERRYGDR